MGGTKPRYGTALNTDVRRVRIGLDCGTLNCWFCWIANLPQLFWFVLSNPFNADVTIDCVEILYIFLVVDIWNFWTRCGSRAPCLVLRSEISNLLLENIDLCALQIVVQHATAYATIFFITDRRDVTEGNYSTCANSNCLLQSTNTKINIQDFNIILYFDPTFRCSVFVSHFSAKSKQAAILSRRFANLRFTNECLQHRAPLANIVYCLLGVDEIPPFRWCFVVYLNAIFVYFYFFARWSLCATALLCCVRANSVSDFWFSAFTHIHWALFCPDRGARARSKQTFIR